MERQMDVNTAMIMVSPETAKYFLSKSIGNYRFSGGKVVDQAVVAKYAAEMKNGNWKISPQGIVFDENDHLIDGHHRLHAVIKANTTVCMAVITNAPEECVEVLDSGIKRTAHLALEYTQGINRVAASKRGWSTAKMHFYFLSGRSKQRARVVTDADMRAFVCKYADPIEMAVHCAEHEANRLRLTVNAACYYAALSAIMCGVPEESVNDFFVVATTGLYESKRQTPAIIFRNKLLETNASRDTLYWGNICEYAQTCLLDYTKGKPRAKAYPSVRAVFTEEWIAKERLVFPEYFES